MKALSSDAFAAIDPALLVIALTGLMCIVYPFDLAQLLLMLGGAVAYALSQGVSRPRVVNKKADKLDESRSKVSAVLPKQHSIFGRAEQKAAATAKPSSTPPTHRLRQRSKEVPSPKQQQGSSLRLQPSSMPVTAPRFQAQTFDDQVDELMMQITSTSQSDHTVEKLAAHVKAVLQELIPEVEVTGFVTGDLTRGTAFGVAVPEVDIVANASPEVLVQRLQSRLARGGLTEGKIPAVQQLDARKLQKSAIRACTDLLVSSGGFKFRRSAFRGEEPKVTMLAPASFSEQAAFPLDFSVNCVMPLYNAAILTECGKIAPRAKALMLFVRRWSKDRGICHAAKGHLPPYAWSLLVIYFLQVSRGERKALLPPVESFEVAKQLAAPSSADRSSRTATCQSAQSQEYKGPQSEDSIASLFREFVQFYTTEVNWRKEAVCARLGSRQQPSRALDIHIILREDGRTDVAPIIEDPFEANRNLSTSMTELGLDRFHEELSRARDLCARGASLSELLDPWKPTEGTANSEMMARKSSEEDDDAPN
mmetsp:Transcript_48779/g.115933  ORF Transcript_48779/g.115933 Transcript_48779/m.115933 type:complete len:536 (+) Transcript_48779:273-1880(+)|eukprot:CAMPEP_0178427102 /NCGR_PEP_ID=MMETSP0689_2-20121128/29571_1 /TAXON_ID=160604 /ORGANISM="Amphidinium massartii, Strain CS-259" /LENGTH=535 /DNA_ID=CAMNT_0020048797 /DNA_START=186 /DNA_END=1793 /DNA_ORIENTATION=-